MTKEKVLELLWNMDKGIMPSEDELIELRYLSVLGLSNTQIRSVPESISQLTELSILGLSNTPTI